MNNNLQKKNNKYKINHINTLYSNTNGNNSLSSYNLKKEGISEINPLEMINQMASSNNSNIFSELQINSNEKIENKKTEEEFNDNNKMTYNDGINTFNENKSLDILSSQFFTDLIIQISAFFGLFKEREEWLKRMVGKSENIRLFLTMPII